MHNNTVKAMSDKDQQELCDEKELSIDFLPFPPSDASLAHTNNATRTCTRTRTQTDVSLCPGAPGDCRDDSFEVIADEENPIKNQIDENEANADSVGPLYKSSRLRGYITLALASFINYDAADNSSGGIGIHVSVIPSTPKQKGYADAVALVSLVVSAACFIVHLDRFSPFRKLWMTLFKSGSKFEGLVLAFLTTWWSVAAGVNTSIRGLAGDGRGQFSLYYSTWVCCFTCYWMMERWGVAAGVCHYWSFMGSFQSLS
jgi:hypothetical protein